MHITMQPILTTNLEDSDDFIYEVKYDGFRTILHWGKKDIQIISRNNKNITQQFPEIIDACKAVASFVEDYLPLQLDGELVTLDHNYQANFSKIQQRGRMKSKERIVEAADKRPTTLLLFDVLQWKGKDVKQQALTQRKQLLHELPDKIQAQYALQIISSDESYHHVYKTVKEYQAEGLVAKRKNSSYISGKSHRDWFKEKNWRTITGFFLEYNAENGYFQIGVFDGEEVIIIGQCKHGLTEKENQTIQQFFTKKGTKSGPSYKLPPAICVKIHTLGYFKGYLREPSFVHLMPNLQPENCTKDQLQIDLAMLPEEVTLSNEQKLYWEEAGVTKMDLLIYTRNIFPYMFPYMKERALTVIRCPEGVEDTCFFQKHVPDYAPEFMKRTDEKIVCNQLASLIWLANHGSVEYHIPFNTIDSTHPDQIIFDLDPPSKADFWMAVETALLFRQVFEMLELTTFVKTSGNKGIQIHLPLPLKTFTYEETAVFTKRIAHMIVEAAPDLCTTERMKNKRQGKLYIDYVQHGKKKTIISPYSTRKTNQATIATPLHWEEVNQNLTPEQFTISSVQQRLREEGCPWYFNYENARYQSFDKAAPLFR